MEIKHKERTEEVRCVIVSSLPDQPELFMGEIYIVAKNMGAGFEAPMAALPSVTKQGLYRFDIIKEALEAGFAEFEKQWPEGT